MGSSSRTRSCGRPSIADVGAHERAKAHAQAAHPRRGRRSDERAAAQIVEAEPAGDSEVELPRRGGRDALSRGRARRRGRLARTGARGAARCDGEGGGAPRARLGRAPRRRAGGCGSPRRGGRAAREPTELATAARLLALALTWSGDADGAVEALESAIQIVEPRDRELAWCPRRSSPPTPRRQASRGGPGGERLERYADLDGATPGERLVEATLAFERARASEPESEAVAYPERALAEGRLLDEQAVDVTGPFYLLLVGFLATDALDLAAACSEQ